MTLFWLVGLGIVLFFLTMKMYKSFAATVAIFFGLWTNLVLQWNGLISGITMFVLYFLLCYLFDEAPRRG